MTKEVGNGRSAFDNQQGQDHRNDPTQEVFFVPSGDGMPQSLNNVFYLVYL